METAIKNVQPTVSDTIEALWTLIQAQKKSVKQALAQRMIEYIDTTPKEAKVKMTEEEFYAKLDKSIESTPTGPIYTMGENESGQDFINRMLSQH